MSVRRRSAADNTSAGTGFPWAGVVLGVLLLALLVAGWWVLQEGMNFPVGQVEVKGEFRHLNRERLSQVVQQRLIDGFLLADLTEVQQAVSALPWVATASVRRIWPDRLEIRVTEQVPVARWGNHSLVTAAGRVFVPDPPMATPPQLRLDGPEESAPEVTGSYLEWSRLLQASGMEIAELRLDARREWQLVTSEGLLIRSGATDVRERLQRFLSIFPQLTRPGQILERVDLRYQQGFAAAWRALPAAPGEQSGAT